LKLTNPESIQDSEKEFIDTINAELDWDAIEQMLLDKHGFSVQEDVNYKDGNLVVHGDQIAYKFDFEIKVPLSVVFDRNGECVEISTQTEDEPEPDLELDSDQERDQVAGDTEIEVPKAPLPVDEMASDIADMISEINEQGE